MTGQQWNANLVQVWVANQRRLDLLAIKCIFFLLSFLTHLWRDNRNGQRFVLQDARAVGIEADEVIEGQELPPANVVVAAVRVDLEVMDLASVAQVGNGVISGLSHALAN